MGEHSCRMVSLSSNASAVQAENAFYRYKTIIGKKLNAKTKHRREVEALLGCIMLSRFAHLRRSRSEHVCSSEDFGV